MRCIFFAALFAGLGLTFIEAKAADYPVDRAPSTMVSPLPARLWSGALWNGAYVGGNVGYGWARASSEFTLSGNAFVNGTVPGNTYDLNGVNGGAQAGYNFRQGSWVLGVEGDIQAANQRAIVLLGCGATCSVTETAKIDWFSTLRGRVGYAMGNTVLLYSTAGLNVTHGSDA